MSLAWRLGALSAANLAFAFLLQSYVLFRLGPGVETDALFAGMTVPQLVLSVISGSLMHVLVPMLVNDDVEAVRKDAWAFVTLVTMLFASLSLLLFMLAPYWVPLTVPGFSTAAMQLTVELTRIQLIGVTFTAVNGVQLAAYHARRQFIWAEFSALCTAAVAFAAMVFALPHFGIEAVAWLLVLRAVMQTALLARGLGRPVRPELFGPTVREAWYRLGPLLLSSGYYKTEPLVDRLLLSMADSGKLSLYFLAQQLYSAAGQLLNRSIAAPAVPMLSRLHKAGDSFGFNQLYNRRLLECGAVCLSAVVVLAVAGQTILDVVLGHGQLERGHINDLWWMLLWLLGTFVGGALGQLSSSAFFALGDTRTPARFGIYSYTVYIPIKLLAFHYFGAAGLALSASLFVVINFAYQDGSLRSGPLRANS